MKTLHSLENQQKGGLLAQTKRETEQQHAKIIAEANPAGVDFCTLDETETKEKIMEIINIGISPLLAIV